MYQSRTSEISRERRMPFSPGLRQSLFLRDRQVGLEISRGDSLEEILDRHLLAVERMARGAIVTSILLLSPDGRHLFHGAGPNVPKSYREAIDGSPIGPVAGSCGTAAYLKRPVYVTDIATDPLWLDYRQFALPHGLLSCWSTPILDCDGAVLGTFAIYSRTIGEPGKDEIDAIDMIQAQVARAIKVSREQQRPAARIESHLKLVSDNTRSHSPARDPVDGLLVNIRRLETLSADLAFLQRAAGSTKRRDAIEAVVRDARELAELLRAHVEGLR
jgi:GAF domain-containing protein